MPNEIGRDEVRRLVDGGAQLVDVLPVQEYADAHLPGAINIPSKTLDAETTKELERDRPVIVYWYEKRPFRRPARPSRG